MLRRIWWWRWLGVGGVLLVLGVPLVGVPRLRTFAASTGLPAGASCATLAASDPTASNSAQWGTTLLRGNGAPGGWFGVDVCGNGINTSNPGGANLSCDHVPLDLPQSGCATGHATYDGFGLTFQCVELVARFAAWAFGDAPRHWVGNAPDLWLPSNHPADFVALPNGGARPPVPGDVLVWGALNASGQPWPAGPRGADDGHVAVIASVQSGSVTIVEQNALWGQQNQASETLPLAVANGRWLVGTATPRATAAPRALYGWLHATSNSGRFNGAGAARGAPITTTTQSPTGANTSAGVPSVASGVVVTRSGTLADLQWAPPGGASAGAPSSNGPAVRVRDLGAPPGTTLPPQTPALVVAPSGTRTVFVVGANGQLASATTVPTSQQVTWRTLSAPRGASLRGPVAAAQLPDALAIAAVGADGQLWWRAGLPDHPGGWARLGRPATTQIVGAPVLAGAPGTGLPFVVVLGADGQLYTASWVGSTGTASAGASWTSWQPLALPYGGATSGAATLLAPLLPILDQPAAGATVGQWADVAVNIFARDSAGTLWWLRRTATAPGWSAHPIPTDGAAGQLLAGVAVQPAATAAGATEVHLYIQTARGIAMGRVQMAATGSMPPSVWTVLAPPRPAAPWIIADASALALGPDASALVAASGTQVIAVAEPSAISLLDGAVAPTPASMPDITWLVLADVAPSADAVNVAPGMVDLPHHPGRTRFPAP